MESGVVPVPVMDITKGYKVTQSVMDLIEQKHGSNMFSGKVEQAWMDVKTIGRASLWSKLKKLNPQSKNLNKIKSI